MPIQQVEIRTEAHEVPADRTVLVLGATGQQGGAVVTSLLSAGWTVRAFVRDPDGDKARRLESAGAEVIRGDLDDRALLEAAMRRVYGVFSVLPSSGQGAAYGVTDEQEIRWGRTVADVALAQEVACLVYSSVNAAGASPTGMGHFDSKSEIEAHIRGLDLRSTIVRPAAFMELLMLPGMGLDQGCFTFFPRPDQVVQMIAVRDIGTIVTAIFADPGRFAGRSIEIAGDAVTGMELGKALGHAAGKPIAYQRFPDSLLAGNDFLGRLASLVDDGRLAGRADIAALCREFGSLTTLADWLAGPGRPLLQAAMQANAADVALR